MAAGGAGQGSSEAGLLVTSAWRLRWRAPELTLVLGERAAEIALAHSDEWARLRGEMLALFALNRLGQGVSVAERAIVAMSAAEAVGEVELGWRLRIELANSARVVGTPLTGFALLRPLLEAGDAPAGLRGAAMVQLVDCLARLGSVPELTDALTEADQLYQQDRQLEADTVVILRALLRAAAAGNNRRWGDLPAAVHAAEEGMAMLSDLSDPAADSGYASGRLVLQRVCALFDLDRGREAERVALEFMERPVRSPLATSVGWLKFALATRLHLPRGSAETAADLLRGTAHLARRHRSEALLTQSLQSLAHVYELTGELTDALGCLRDAHAAERRRQRAVHGVRMMLIERLSSIQPPGHETADAGTSLRDQVAATLRRGRIRRDVGRGSAPIDMPGLLSQTGFLRRLDAVVNDGGTTDTLALVLLDLGGSDPADAEPQPEEMLNSLVERVRSSVPSEATLARVDGDELAVLLPGTTRDEAQRWVAELRSAIGLPVTVNAGVAEHWPGARTEDLFTQADRALAEAKRPAPIPLPGNGFRTDTDFRDTDFRDAGFRDAGFRDNGYSDDTGHGDTDYSDTDYSTDSAFSTGAEPFGADQLLDAPFLGDPRLDEPVHDEPVHDTLADDTPVEDESVEDEPSSEPAAITPLPSSAVPDDFGHRLDDAPEAEEDEDTSWPVLDRAPEPHREVTEEFEDEAVPDEDHPALGESPEPAFFEAPTTPLPVISDAAERYAPADLTVDEHSEDDYSDDPDYPEQETSFSAEELETRSVREAEPQASGTFELPSGLLPSVVSFAAMPDPDTRETGTADLDDELVEITEVRLEPEPVVESYHHDGWSEPDELELSPAVLPRFGESEPAPEHDAEYDTEDQTEDQVRRDSVAELLAQVMAMSKGGAESLPVDPAEDEPELSEPVPVRNNGWTDPAETRSAEPAREDDSSAYDRVMAHDFLAEMRRADVEATAEATPEPEPDELEEDSAFDGLSFSVGLPVSAPQTVEGDEYEIPEARADWPPVLTSRDLRLPGSVPPAAEEPAEPQLFEPRSFEPRSFETQSFEPQPDTAESPRNGWANGFPAWPAPTAETPVDSIPEPPPAPKLPEPSEDPERPEPSPIPDVPEPQPIPDEPGPDAIPEPPRPVPPPHPEAALSIGRGGHREPTTLDSEHGQSRYADADQSPVGHDAVAHRDHARNADQPGIRRRAAAAKADDHAVAEPTVTEPDIDDAAVEPRDSAPRSVDHAEHRDIVQRAAGHVDVQHRHSDQRPIARQQPDIEQTPAEIEHRATERVPSGGAEQRTAEPDAVEQRNGAPRPAARANAEPDDIAPKAVEHADVQRKPDPVTEPPVVEPASAAPAEQATSERMTAERAMTEAAAAAPAVPVAEAAAAEPEAQEPAPAAPPTRVIRRRSLAAEFASWANSPEATGEPEGRGDERDSDRANTGDQPNTGDQASPADRSAAANGPGTNPSLAIHRVVQRRTLDEAAETPPAAVAESGTAPAAAVESTQGDSPQEEPSPAEQPEQQPGERKRLAGGPSSRRRSKAGIGLAELLAEAMVAYESSKYEAQNTTVIPDAVALDSMLEQQHQRPANGTPPAPPTKVVQAPDSATTLMPAPGHSGALPLPGQPTTVVPRPDHHTTALPTGNSGQHTRVVPAPVQETTFLRPQEFAHRAPEHRSAGHRRPEPPNPDQQGPDQRTEYWGEPQDMPRTAPYVSSGHLPTPTAEPRHRNEMAPSGEHPAPTYDSGWLARTQRAPLSMPSMPSVPMGLPSAPMGLPPAPGEYGTGEPWTPFGAAAGAPGQQDPSARHRGPVEPPPAAAPRPPAVASDHAEFGHADLPPYREDGPEGSRPWVSYGAPEQQWSSLDRGHSND
ncbi:diguanylate cyclase [Allokutzneria sp. A3M-2-11 16]|uniref:diguanylate cyclase domain-containing protein n=1 Tax=Allokutzneria sp. A3M-2-11 16 TaxID=2962043 RepID=UPI0020B7CF3E|nr:diguanylate cyclase [Allokutzneria sp. A3M-2-11 16]MCP3800891.1 diguanylate cyclase [Allokutzneria sp. A3M-2-11 16]